MPAVSGQHAKTVKDYCAYHLSYYGLERDVLHEVVVVWHLCLEEVERQVDTTVIGLGLATTGRPEALDVFTVLIKLENVTLTSRAVTALIAQRRVCVTGGETGHGQGMQEVVEAILAVGEALLTGDLAVIALENGQGCHVIIDGDLHTVVVLWVSDWTVNRQGRHRIGIGIAAQRLGCMGHFGRFVATKDQDYQ